MTTSTVLQNPTTYDIPPEVARAQAGDITAFEAIVRGHTQRLMWTAQRMTKNKEDAEDAVQETFIRAFLKIKTFRGDSLFSTWLTRIGINSVLMKRRQKKNITEPISDIFASDGSIKNEGFEKDVHIARQYRSPLTYHDPAFKKVEQTLDFGPLRVELKNTLQKIPERFLRYCVACFLLDMDNKEIAAMCGGNVNTFKSTNVRVTKWLGNNCPEISIILKKTPKYQSQTPLLRFLFEHTFGDVKKGFAESIQESEPNVQVCYLMEKLRDGILPIKN